MSQISGEDFVSALNKDPEYLMQEKSVINFMNEFMLAIPEALREFLDAPVTVTSIVNTKVAFIQFCIENNYVSKVIAASPQDSFGWMDPSVVAEMIQDALSNSFDLFSKFASDIPQFLREYGISEEKMMYSFELRPELMERYRTGTLTIGELLMLQPMVILKNSK